MKTILCGTGRQIINPENGHNLAGYGNEYPCMGVHDDLAVTALYMNDGDTDAVLMVFDLAGTLRPLVTAIREAAGAAAGVPAERVFTACTHTHTGPETRTMSWYGGPKKTAREEYNQKLIQWAASAAAAARADAEPCTLHYNFTQVPVNMNRRYSLPDRRALYIPQYKQLAGTSPEYVDHELGVIVFRKAGTPNRYKALISNYSAHPVCIGNSSNLASADYQGVLRATVEETFEGARCLTLTGAAGDLHPLHPEAGFAYAHAMGSALGQAVIERTYDAVPAATDLKLRMVYREIDLLAKDRASAELLPEKADRKQKIYVMREGMERITTDFYILGIGPIMIAGVPGELVAELGARLKWSSPFLKTYIAYQATDNIQYIAAAGQYRWGGYEAITACIAAGQGEGLVDAINASAGELLNRAPLDLPPVDAGERGYE